jgi:ketosteroid isomerase-like protein
MAVLPPWALAISFIDAINGNDLDRMAALMVDGHTLVIFDEAPVVGRATNLQAWAGYCGSWPNYVIYPRRMAQVGDDIAILGHTTGSHLEVPDDEESALTLIWICRTGRGQVTAWELLEDTAANRARWDLA